MHFEPRGASKAQAGGEAGLSRDADIKRLEAALVSKAELGESTVRCDRCGEIISVAVTGTRTDTRCTCGKFNDTLRGI